MSRNFRNIKAWKLADDMVMSVYSETRHFPAEELYGITSQLRRASVSVPTNISEGSSRKHNKEYLKFPYIANGSMAEVEYLLHLSNRLGYLSEENYSVVEQKRKEAAKTLSGLISAVEKDAPIR
jgi:four helix bundle protein